MGCGDACPYVPTTRRGLGHRRSRPTSPSRSVREIRDEIEARVRGLDRRMRLPRHPLGPHGPPAAACARSCRTSRSEFDGPATPTRRSAPAPTPSSTTTKRRPCARFVMTIAHRRHARECLAAESDCDLARERPRRRRWTAATLAAAPRRAPPPRALAAFALVFAGCGAIVADADYDGALGDGRRRPRLRAVIMVDGLRHRPPLGRAHQPGGDARVHAHAPLPGARGRRLHRRAAGRRDRAARCCCSRVWPDQPAHLGATVPSVGAGSALVYELVLTAFLMFVIMAVATDTRAVGAAAAIAIGGTVGLDALFGGPVTGASMNPARSFGPALAARRVERLLDLPRRPVAGRRARRARLPARARRAAEPGRRRA